MIVNSFPSLISDASGDSSLTVALKYDYADVGVIRTQDPLSIFRTFELSHN
ncbi:MAG: hypothetical protein ACI9G1_003852 [Pirellulaceae bacterium]|jgi:hypothetical protein